VGVGVGVDVDVDGGRKGGGKMLTRLLDVGGVVVLGLGMGMGLGEDWGWADQGGWVGLVGLGVTATTSREMGDRDRRMMDGLVS